MTLAISLSRSSWLAAFFGGLFVLKVFKTPVKHIIAMGMLITLVFLISISILDYPILERIETIKTLAGSQENMLTGDIRRIDQLQITRNILLKKPMLGVGWGNYQYVSNTFKPSDLRQQPELPPHSALLMMASEAGFLGLFIYLAALMLTAKRILEMRRYFKKTNSKGHLLPYYVGLTASLIAFFIFQFFQPALFKESMWISLGMLVSLYYFLKQENQ